MKRNTPATDLFQNYVNYFLNLKLQVHLYIVLGQNLSAPCGQF